MIDEDPVPLMTSVNIVSIDLNVVSNAKNDVRLSPDTSIRKSWIPKQYLVHRDD